MKLSRSWFETLAVSHFCRAASSCPSRCVLGSPGSPLTNFAATAPQCQSAIAMATRVELAELAHRADWVLAKGLALLRHAGE